jgi:hypothetical protein
MSPGAHPPSLTDSRVQPRAGKAPAALEEAEREPAETV